MKKESSLYMNPLTDFGFKKLFGDETNKEFLLDFLNSLLKDEQGLITDLNFQNTERLGLNPEDRNAIYDLYCTNESGEHFIVELQRAKQTFFVDRTVYYSSFLIQKQGKRKQNWNYELQAVYTIALLDFEMDKTNENKNKFYYNIKLHDSETHEFFYPKLTFIYVELPKFQKKAKELHTHFEKWVYLFRNLESLELIPENLKEHIFMKLIETAKLENLPKSDRKNYQESLKRYRDNYNVIETAKLEGKMEGISEGLSKVVKNAHKKGLTISLIAELTGLTEEEILAIL